MFVRITGETHSFWRPLITRTRFKVSPPTTGPFGNADVPSPSLKRSGQPTRLELIVFALRRGSASLARPIDGLMPGIIRAASFSMPVTAAWRYHYVGRGCVRLVGE